jgi:hypothetical protein
MDESSLVPDHIDNNGLNNYVDNLRWLTRSENVKAAFEKGYCNTRGEHSNVSFITDIEATKICEMIQNKYSYDEIIEKMNFPDNNKYRRLLIRIKHGTSFRYIAKNYTFPKIVYKKNLMIAMRSIPIIMKLTKDNKTIKEIIEVVYGDSENDMKNRIRIITNVVKRQIFIEEIEEYESSTTRERLSNDRTE